LVDVFWGWVGLKVSCRRFDCLGGLEGCTTTRLTRYLFFG